MSSTFASKTSAAPDEGCVLIYSAYFVSTDGLRGNGGRETFSRYHLARTNICLADGDDEGMDGKSGESLSQHHWHYCLGDVTSMSAGSVTLDSVHVCRVHIAADGKNNSPVVGTSDKSNLVRRKMIRCDTGPSRRHFAWLGDGWEKGKATMSFLKP